ncbi:MAG TPA: hypothetical protein VNE67_01990 [Acetobacteraceae bacterium]|nr:hypothetical protein [Acetobacteraceae bacterium]
MSAAAPSPPATSAWALAGRFARFIGGLREAMATGAEHNPALMDIAARLWNRLTEAAERFAAIAAHPVARSRRRPAEPTPIPADGVPADAAPANLTPVWPPAPRRTLPRRYGWLARMAPETVPSGIEFAYLLAQPEMTELLATAPRLWRVLRPLCRMFGITPPEALPQAPATPPRRAPEAARDPTARAGGPKPRQSGSTVRTGIARRFSAARPGRAVVRPYCYDMTTNSPGAIPPPEAAQDGAGISAPENPSAGR